MNTQPNAAPAPVAPEASAPKAPTPIAAADTSAPHTTFEDRDARLAGSITDAYTLLDFSCRRGDAPDAALSQVIVESYQKLEDDVPLSATDEVTFWSAFAEITEMVKPVTVESIVFTTPSPPQIGVKKQGLFSRTRKPVGPAEKVLRHYLLTAIVTLMVLLMLQVGWAIGTLIYNDAYKVHHNILLGQNSVHAAELNVQNVKGTPAEPQALLNLEAAKNLESQDQSWNTVSYIRLTRWNDSAKTFLPPFDFSFMNSSDPAKHILDTQNLGEEGLQRLAFTRTELSHQVISNYYLVVLFDMLGELTQALRSLSREIQSVSLTANDP